MPHTCRIMADPHAETRALLDERPDIEAAIEDVLAADGTGAWTFEDIDADSGTFGKPVARGIVEKTAAGDYLVADREAVQAVLAVTRSSVAGLCRS